MAYIDQNAPHAGSAEVLFTGLFDEPSGTVARTIARSDLSNAAINPTTGQVMAHLLPLPQGLIVTNIAVHTGSTAAVAPTHFWVGLCDFSMNVLAVSADQGSAAIGTGTFFKLAMTQAYQIPQTGNYYVVCSASATTTMPTFAGGSTTASGISAVAPIHTGTAGTQAAPPSIGAQLNSGAPTANGIMNFGAWIS